MVDIYLCLNEDDQAKNYQLLRALEAKGFKVYFPEQTISQHIDPFNKKKDLLEAKVVLAVITEHPGENFLSDLVIAKENSKPVLGFVESREEIKLVDEKVKDILSQVVVGIDELLKVLRIFLALS